jgi:Predicted kinase
MPGIDAILTENTVPDYLEKHANEIGVFSPGAKLTAKAIVGGNVNYAFCATEEGTDKKIFVKQAPDFVAVFGPDGLPLTSERMNLEMAVFDEWKELLGPELSVKYLPKIHYFDGMFNAIRISTGEGSLLFRFFLKYFYTAFHASLISYKYDTCNGFLGISYIAGS